MITPTTESSQAISALAKFKIEPLPEAVRLIAGGNKKFADLGEMAVAIKHMKNDQCITFPYEPLLLKYRIKDIKPFAFALASKCKKIGTKCRVMVMHGTVYITGK